MNGLWARSFLWLVISIFFVLFAAEMRLRSLAPIVKNNEQQVNSSVGSQELRILAIGDSITLGTQRDGSYPQVLAEKLKPLLREGVKVVVFNEATPGAVASDFEERLPAFLDKYRPHIVISMLGFDQEFPLQPLFTAYPWLWNLRIIRFWELYRLRGGDFFWPKLKKILGGAKNETAPSWRQDLSPESFFTQAVESRQDNVRYLRFFGEVLRREKRFSEALGYHEKILEKYPDHRAAWMELGQTHLALKNWPMAESALKKATQLPPRQGDPEDLYLWSFYVLALAYEGQGHWREAEALYLSVLKNFPSQAQAYEYLAVQYRKQKRFQELAAILEKGISHLPNNIRLRYLLAEQYRAEKKEERANEQEVLAEQIQKANPFLWRARLAYEKIQEAISSRGTLHVALPYPQRSVSSLQRIFPDPGEHLLLVENEQNFRSHIRERGFSAVFLDDFGGNFGHMNQQGCELVAENLLRSLMPWLRQKAWLR